ncbi:aspartate kinase [Urechidicola sp. KH5]
MKVFKFGGASVKDAESVKNVANVLSKEANGKTVVVISAMGKMTNAFENIVHAYFNQTETLKDTIDYVYNFHLDIIQELFKDTTKTEIATNFIDQLQVFLNDNSIEDYNYVYDQIVGYGELISTSIVSAYLESIGCLNNWIDVRTLIKTDDSYRDAKVNWDTTLKNIEQHSFENLTITQGFLGGCGSDTTTLGREGSDFTAGIFAYCLDADTVTIWKDVNGVLNAHPKHFDDTTLLENISYKEAIEMAYYGASVIHPKTLKPLENKLIPLRVRSFYNLENQGTLVSKGEDVIPKVPCFILKQNQILVSISTADFSFMVEHHLSDVFNKLHENRLKVNLVQNSALSFSVCIEDKFGNFQAFFESVKKDYKVYYNTDTTLYTIRHYTKEAIAEIEQKGTVLLKQASRETVQIVIE